MKINFRGIKDARYISTFSGICATFLTFELSLTSRDCVSSWLNRFGVLLLLIYPGRDLFFNFFDIAFL